MNADHAAKARNASTRAEPTDAPREIASIAGNAEVAAASLSPRRTASLRAGCTLRSFDAHSSGSAARTCRKHAAPEEGARPPPSPPEEEEEK